MIKEKKKVKKNKFVEFKQEVSGYIRTAFIAFFAGAVIALLLSFHARSEMIKNLYVDKEQKSKIEQQLAKQMIAHSDLIAKLATKNYSLCMQIGNLYEVAEDYRMAEYAYNLAIEKMPDGVYTPYYKLIVALLAQDKIDEAEKIVESVNDVSSVKLIKFKTRAYIIIGDKYFSINKFLKSANSYEKAYYYYDRFKKKDKIVEKSIKDRLVSAYLETAAVIIKNGYNSDGIRFLKKALKYNPNDYRIRYRLAVVYSDLDPIKSIKYFENLLEKIPQDIDYNVYNSALMKAANIEELQGNIIKAKQYRYRIHTIDLFVNKKVVYKDDLEVYATNFNVKKSFFRYKLKFDFKIKNVSNNDIYNLTADFVLKHADKEKEATTLNVANKKHPLLANDITTDDIEVTFGKNIFTKKELANYYVDVYLYKDKKYKTLVGTYDVPVE